MGDSADRIVRHCAAELLRCDLFTRYRLDYLRACDEHLACLVNHKDKVRNCRGIYRAARTGPHDDGDLRDHSR
ncbi:hypothetical protein SDC9_159661 [bioreactor metagenome]|uniref:Uncharacterized protein n=1 Tax=bioreactor metagenome TaxID=1076179 RepID=A0A645FD67_9ZZZZ